MKYLGEVITKKVVEQTVRPIEYIRCDMCNKKILPCDTYKSDKSDYIRVHTWHNDWGNDSVESHEYYDLCKECAKEFVADYIEHCDGSEELELEHEYLGKNETYNGNIRLFDSGYKLVSKDIKNETEK